MKHEFFCLPPFVNLNFHSDRYKSSFCHLHSFICLIPAYIHISIIFVNLYNFFCFLGFPNNSEAKECACNAEDLCLTPRSGRSLGGPLGQEDPLETGMAIYFNILAGESHGQKSLVGYSSWVRQESDTTEKLTLQSRHFKFQ